jgi:PAS domain-containing protein
MRHPLDDTATSSAARMQRQNPRIHLLDDMWLLTILAILVAIGVPWLFSGFEVQAGSASWGLLALGGVHVALTLLASSAPASGRWRDHALTLLDAIGVALIGFIWSHVGAMQNPLFLTIFALPVVGSIFLSRWHPFLIAALSVLVVVIVALGQTPDLRSYAAGLLGSHASLLDWIARRGAVPEGAFSGFYAPTGYLVVVIEVLAVVLFACAVAAEYIGTIFERLLASSLLARAEADKAQELWATLIERLPLPALLLDPNSLCILGCSRSALTYLGSEGASLEGRNLFEVARFSFTDLVQALIAAANGSASLTALHLADEVRLTQLRALQIVHRKRRLALLTLEDVTEEFCLKAAWDASEFAALIVDAGGRVRAFNRPARAIFGGIRQGASAEQLLSQVVSGRPWWESGLTRRRKMHIDIGSRIYAVTSSEIALPGEEQRLYSVSLIAVARAELGDLSEEMPRLQAPFPESPGGTSATRRPR